MIDAKARDAFRVLHTADWHLGKLLGEHSRETEHTQFLQQLLANIHDHDVDALIIAGDVFDSANPPQSALAQYYDFLSKLYRETDCCVVVIGGNHDSPGNLEAPRQLLRSLRTYVVGAKPAESANMVIPLPSPEAPRLLVAALPFLRDRDLRVGQSGQNAADIQKDLVKGIRQCYVEAAATARATSKAPMPILATGHLTVTGCTTSDSERDVHIGGLGAVTADVFPSDFAYVALGHLHRPQKAGVDHVRYSGSPIALSFSESKDSKELRLLDFDARGLALQQSLPVPAFRQLVQITTRPDTFSADLARFIPKAGPLKTWVEIIVEDPVPGENLYDLAQKQAVGRDFEVIRVVSKRTKALTGASLGETDPAGDLDQALSDPRKVFEMRLEREPGLLDADKEALRLAFTELCEIQAHKVADLGGAKMGGRS